ncbi:enoyl-CoA hydratase/isomerase family protein [Rhodobacteraceae bacterium NNCM2]|nr:enoyl-CoA hydratase/isomerase family protein [Coraliihabitans acroporae]
MAEVLIRVEGRAGRITLNRPGALNALTYDMLLEIEKALDAWAGDDTVSLVLIDAAGDKAFAAGGDIVDLYRTGREGDFAYGRRFWADEYRINAKVSRYAKPYVAVMHGFVMGGGVGVSALGSHRIVTDGSQVAMPECGIGLVPDVGGSKLLADAPGHLGEYLGMTSMRMGPGDAIYTGFADCYVPMDRLEALKARLVETGDPAVIDAFAETPPEAPLAAIQAEVDQIFAADDPRDVLDPLAASPSDWAAAALKAIRRNCPISVACTHAMVRNAREMTRIEDALAQEYRFIWRCMEEGEFLEGIRAAVIDKDRKPQWARPRLEDIGPEDVAHMLSPPPGGDLAL